MENAITAHGLARRDSRKLQLPAFLRAIALIAAVVTSIHGPSFDVAAADGIAATDAVVEPTGPRPLAVAAQTTAPTGFVTRVGTQLMLDGRPFRFTGLNIYNANSRDNCWYSMGNDDDVLDTSLAAIGPAQNVFRSWFFQRLATRGGIRDWSAFDHTLAVAARHGQRVIVTLADQWGACEDDSASIYKVESWYQTGYRTPGRSDLTSYRDWVAEVVARYRDNPTVLMWQLMNEAENKVAGMPVCGAPATLKTWADDMSRLVKSVDARHLVSIGTIGSGQCGAVFEDYAALHSSPDVDLCEYHDYGAPGKPIPGDAWNGLAKRIAQCNALRKPLFIGESGIRDTPLPTRAGHFDAKLRAQFEAGVAGVLVWAWNGRGSAAQDFDIGPGDPLLGVLQQYSAFGAAATYALTAVSFTSGQTTTVPITITNTGRRIFPATDPTPVRLSYHWLDGSGATVVWDGLRTALPADLKPGQSVQLRATVSAPPNVGQFTLRFDLVEEGIVWFSDRGNPTGDLPVAVTEPTPSVGY